MALKLNKREKMYIAAAIGAIGIFVILQFLVFPLFDKSEWLTKAIATRQQELNQIKLLQAEYKQSAQKAEASKHYLKARKKGFTLFSFLDTLAGRTGVKSHIAYMKPTITPIKDTPYRRSMVEMKLNEITMSQLLSFLHGIETSRDVLSIKRLSITTGEKKADLINSVFQVETLEM
jgi:general secretion pathway protein M